MEKGFSHQQLGTKRCHRESIKARASAAYHSIHDAVLAVVSKNFVHPTASLNGVLWVIYQPVGNDMSRLWGLTQNEGP